MKKEKKQIKKWVIGLLIFINMILISCEFDSIKVQLSSYLIMGLNTLILFKYDKKYLFKGD